MPGRSSPSPSRISAMSAPTPRTSRPLTPAARGLVLREDITAAFQLARGAGARCLAQANGITGIAGVDTRQAHRAASATAARPTACCASPPDGRFDLDALLKQARDLARASKAWTSPKRSRAAKAITGTRRAGPGQRLRPARPAPRHHVVAVDYGAKRNILRCLAARGLPASRWCRRRPLPTTFCATSPTACSCPTARAIRRRPANTPCR